MSAFPDDWTEEQNAMFTKVFKFMIGNQSAIRHPSAQDMPEDHWHTICHNAAWTAAEMLTTDELTVIDADTDQVLAHSPKGLNS